MERPSFKVNVAANRDVTAGRTLFVKLPANSSIKIRIIPPLADQVMVDAGMLMFPAFNHYQFKDGGEDRAWACLARHVRGVKCPIDQLVKPYVAKNSKHGTEIQRKTAKNIRVNSRFYVQCLVAGKEDEGPKLFALAKTAADDINERLAMQEAEQLPYASDTINGEWIVVSKKGSGMNTRWKAQGTGVQVSLDELYPSWREDILPVEDTVSLNIATREKLIASLYENYGDVFPLDEVFTPESV